MRLFVGIALADVVVRELESAAARLRASGGPAIATLRWTAPESWHVTLQFLGNATPEQYACLLARLGEVRSAPVPVELGALGCFDRAGVLFADVQTAPGLAALARSVAAATGCCGFVAETRPFHPHITLARKTGSKGAKEQGSKKTGSHARVENIGRGVTLRDLLIHADGGPNFSRFTAREFLLYESHLEARGARYEVRGRFPLRET
jgi:2'-5' RNA ligase